VDETVTMTRQRKKLMSLIEPDIDSDRKSGSMKQKVNERRRRSQHKIVEIFTAAPSLPIFLFLFSCLLFFLRNRGPFLTLALLRILV